VGAAWLVSLTWRFEVIAEEGVTPLSLWPRRGGEIFCFWHQCVLPCTVYFRRTHATILISRSFDGELITRILELFGFRCGARFQLARRARRAAGAEAGDRKRASPAIFTADGPRGPIYPNQDGAHQAGANDRRAHRRLSPATRARLDHALVGPLPGAQAIHADRGQLGAMDAGSRRSYPQRSLNQKREELNAAIERARLRAGASRRHFKKASIA
jgi:hypothetical protein